MKRGLVFSLCALALASLASSAMAQANLQLSLNLRYTDPADPSEGGTWQLVAKTNDADGIAAVVAYLQNAGTVGQTSINTGIGALTAVGNPPGPAILDRGNSIIEIVYGQDMTTAGTVPGVGTGDGPGGAANKPAEIVSDPLRNATWNGASLIASGQFGGTRPSFATLSGKTSDGNTLPTTINGTTPAVDANTTTTVRGDSLVSLGLNTPANSGLRAGDANRDGTVNGADFNLLAFNFGQSNKGWDQGDFNDSGAVDGADFNLLAFNFGQSAPAPTVAAVPEPASVALVGIALCGMYMARRRS